MINSRLVLFPKAKCKGLLSKISKFGYINNLCLIENSIIVLSKL